jgi:hypothetical protein
MDVILRKGTPALVVASVLALAPGLARAQYPCPTYANPTVSPFYTQPYTPPAFPNYFVGSSYNFYGPPSYSASNYGPSYNGPQFYNPRYLNPGPYYFSTAYSYTPGYYSYYYTPGWFRY